MRSTYMALCVLVMALPAQAWVYVNAAAGAPGGSHNTANTAYTTLQAAVNAEASGTEIRIISDLSVSGTILTLTSLTTASFTLTGWDDVAGAAINRTLTATGTGRCITDAGTTTASLTASYLTWTTAVDGAYVISSSGDRSYTFDHCSFTKTDGNTGLCFYFPAVANATRTLTMTNCTVRGRDATLSNSLYLRGFAGVYLTDCTIQTGPTSGAGKVSDCLAIGLFDAVTVFKALRCTIESNRSGYPSINTTSITAGTLFSVRNCTINGSGCIKAPYYWDQVVIEGNTCTVLDANTGVQVGDEIVSAGGNNAHPLGRCIIRNNTISEPNGTAHALFLGDGSGPGECSGNTVIGGNYGIVCKAGNLAGIDTWDGATTGDGGYWIHHNKVLSHATGGTVALFLAGSSRNVVEHNTVVALSGNACSLNVTQSKAISTENIVRDNIFVSKGTGYALSVATDAAGAKDNVIAGNLFWVTGSGKLASIAGTDCDTLQAIKDKWAATYAGTMYTSNGSGDLLADPLFISSTAGDAAFLRIPFKSPARGAATNAYGDIGADQRKERLGASDLFP